MTDFKEKLRVLREDRGMKIVELSKRSGVSVSYISMLENGLLKNDPTDKIAQKLDDALEANGQLASRTATYSTTVMKKIYEHPGAGEKMNKILDKVQNNPELIEKMWKAVIG